LFDKYKKPVDDNSNNLNIEHIKNVAMK